MTGEGAASTGLSDDHPAVELSQPSEEELAGTTEETVYTSAISESKVVCMCRPQFEVLSVSLSSTRVCRAGWQGGRCRGDQRQNRGEVLTN